MIQVSHLTKIYGPRTAINDLNFEVKAGEIVAIVGPSGAGKTSLMNLLPRFYDVNEGRILIDGVDVKKYNIRELRQRMGLVMQEPTLFNYTIKENVLYGKQDVSNEEIVNAC